MTDTDDKYPQLAEIPDFKIQELAEGHYKDRKGLSADEVQRCAQELLLDIERRLKLVHALTYLEAKLRCDSFYEGKNHAGDVGETYGYLNSRVEMNKGSIDMYFQSKRPGGDGFFKRTRISKAKKTGYADSRLRHHAAHEFEARLAIYTEWHYKRLRDQGGTLKRMLKMLREIEILKSED